MRLFQLPSSSSCFIYFKIYSAYFCFKLCSRLDPPVVPKDFVPHHKFPGPLETDSKLAVPLPPEVPPPEDNNLKLLIEGVATLVARCGKLFEDISREKNKSNPLFSFLTGGNGHDYYARKLWEAHQKRNDQTKLVSDGKSSETAQKLTAETRGKLLGETPLERSARDSSFSVGSENGIQIQFNLSDTFTKSASFVSSLLLVVINIIVIISISIIVIVVIYCFRKQITHFCMKLKNVLMKKNQNRGWTSCPLSERKRKAFCSIQKYIKKCESRCSI